MALTSHSFKILKLKDQSTIWIKTKTCSEDPEEKKFQIPDLTFVTRSEMTIIARAIYNLCPIGDLTLLLKLRKTKLNTEYVSMTKIWR